SEGRDAEPAAGRPGARASEGHQDGPADSSSGDGRPGEGREEEDLDDGLVRRLVNRACSDLGFERLPEGSPKVSLFLAVVLQRAGGLFSRQNKLDVELFRQLRLATQEFCYLLDRRSRRPVPCKRLGYRGKSFSGRWAGCGYGRAALREMGGPES